MELGESIRRPSRQRVGLLAALGAVAFVAAGPAVAWADQSNDNSTTTNATGGAPVVAPVTGALQLNLACAANLNVLGNQAGSGSCSPDAQANSNSSATTVGGDGVMGLVAGTVVAPITAAVQANVNCPINVNVLSSQRSSGNCTPGPQSNANTATTHVRTGGALADVLGGPIVAPITTGVGLNVTCPANVNVLSSQQGSGLCLDTPATSSVPDAPPSGPPVAPPAGDSPPADSVPVPADAPATTTMTADSQLPGPPDAGATSVGQAVGRAVGRFPALGALVLVVLAGAAMAVRRFQQDR
jgi:hypothetical protein